MARPRPRLPAPPHLPTLPDPVLGFLRALGLPATEVAHYWQQEARSIRTGSTALLIGLVATLIAGTVLGVAREQLAQTPGLLVLIPAAIGMRGSIFGALAARLGTGILTGEFEPELRRGTFLGRHVEAAGILSVTTSTEAGVVAWLIGRLLGLETVSVLDLIAVSLVGGVVSSLALVGVTIQITRVAERRGWNIDDVGAPTITATGDLITLPALLLAAWLVGFEPTGAVTGALGLVVGVVTLVVGWRHEDPVIRRVVRESLVVLTIAVTIDVLAGMVMESRAEELLTLPSLLVLIPPFIANCGSLGGMLASRFSSKLHVGLMHPRAFPGKTAGLDISLTALLAMLAFAGVGSVGWLAAVLAGLSPPGPLVLIAVALVAGAFATVLLSLVAYAAAGASFRFGLDPDNHGIPIVTAAMDFLGVLCLVGAVVLLQVG